VCLIAATLFRLTIIASSVLHQFWLANKIRFTLNCLQGKGSICRYNCNLQSYEGGVSPSGKDSSLSLPSVFDQILNIVVHFKATWPLRISIKNEKPVLEFIALNPSLFIYNHKLIVQCLGFIRSKFFPFLSSQVLYLPTTLK